ncbi:MAG TPA: hypothetical protein V6C86_17590 [Oculatellaceae cyanobacterium]
MDHKQNTDASVPSEEDWGDWESDMEQEYAHSRFAGKSLEDARPLFESSILGCAENIAYMPEVPFRYYIFGFRDYVMDPRRFQCMSADDSDGPSAFLKLLVSTLRDQPARILPVMNELLPVAEFVAKNQDKYEATEKIYGSFDLLLTEIKSLYNEARSADLAEQRPTVIILPQNPDRR